MNERQVIRDHQGILSAYRGRDLVAVRNANYRINERVAAECYEALRKVEAVLQVSGKDCRTSFSSYNDST